MSLPAPVLPDPLCFTQGHIYLTALPEKALPRYRAAIAQWDQDIYDVVKAAERRREAGQPMDRVLIFSRQSFPIIRPKPPKAGGKKPPVKT